MKALGVFTPTEINVSGGSWRLGGETAPPLESVPKRLLSTPCMQRCMVARVRLGHDQRVWVDADALVLRTDSGIQAYARRTRLGKTADLVLNGPSRRHRSTSKMAAVGTRRSIYDNHPRQTSHVPIIERPAGACARHQSRHEAIREQPRRPRPDVHRPTRSSHRVPRTQRSRQVDDHEGPPRPRRRRRRHGEDR